MVLAGVAIGAVISVVELTVIVVDDDVVVGTPVVTVAAAPEGVAEDEGVEGRGEVVIISEERGTLTTKSSVTMLVAFLRMKVWQ